MLLLQITPALNVQGALAVPFSKPLLPSNCVGPEAEVTVSEIVVLWVRLPDIPVTVIVADAGAAELAAVSVSVLVVAVAAGLNEALTPEGKPVTDRVTVPVKPFDGLTVIVLVPLAPAAMLRLAGEADSE